MNRFNVGNSGKAFPVGILMTRRLMEPPEPPAGILLDFWTSAYQAIGD
jgi:hypothetical protein